jgi:isocitrate dehydrogenase kinase/phosphatase
VASEPWFSVGPNDIFPAELPTFIFPSGGARETFLELHADLVRPDFWVETQQRIRDGRQEKLFLPYPESVRFQ